MFFIDNILIDEEDADLLKDKFYWSPKANCLINKELQKLHRLIYPEKMVYCLDGNKRNVTRCNLSKTKNPKYNGELEIRRTVLVGDKFGEHKKQFNNKDEAKRYFFWLFSISPEDFLDSKLEYQEGIPLKNGGFALVDEQDVKNILVVRL